MGINYPEVNFAKKIVRRHKLVPPFNIQAILEQYATVIFDDIPLVDGISLNIKIFGKTPTVIVNNNAPSSRQHFTMAHELGHIIIPWHIGTLIADKLDIPQAERDAAYMYWVLEGEANRFAAEILMPEDWVREQIHLYPDLAQLHEIVVNQCGVSPWAAAIRLAALLPPHIVYCSENGIVTYSGRTEGTYANPVLKGESIFDLETFSHKNFYPYSTEKYSWRAGGQDVHWWRLPGEVDTTTADTRTWKEIQNDIISSIEHSGTSTELKYSINGIIGAANSKYKRIAVDYNAQGLIAACMQRFYGRDELDAFVTHSDFKVFLQKRAIEIVNNAKA